MSSHFFYCEIFIMKIKQIFENKYCFLMLYFLGVAAGAILLLFFEPKTTRWLPQCIFYKLTNLHCPGCGNTRALYHLVHGNFLQSIRNNCLLIPAVIVLICLLIFPKWAQKRYVNYGILIIVVGFFILRNIPLYPFTLLAPI